MLNTLTRYFKLVIWFLLPFTLLNGCITAWAISEALKVETFRTTVNETRIRVVPFSKNCPFRYTTATSSTANLYQGCGLITFPGISTLTREQQLQIASELIAQERQIGPASISDERVISANRGLRGANYEQMFFFPYTASGTAPYWRLLTTK